MMNESKLVKRRRKQSGKTYIQNNPISYDMMPYFDNVRIFAHFSVFLYYTKVFVHVWIKSRIRLTLQILFIMNPTQLFLVVWI